MPDITVEYGGTTLDVSIESPTIAVEVSSAQLVLPVVPSNVPGPPGATGPPGPQGSPGPSGPQGPVGPPPTAAGQIYATHWPPVLGDTGYTVTQSPPPAWMIPGTWNFWLSSGANAIAGTFRVTGVAGNTVSFDSWVPAS